MKIRVMACLTVLNGWVVQSVGFKTYLPVGRPEIAVEFLDDWGVDEIMLLDIGATLEGRSVDERMVERVSMKCFVPMTVGGGVTCVNDARKLLQCGADKIVINSAIYSNPHLIGDISAKFGSQCVVAAIDAKRLEGHKSSYHAMTHSGARDSGYTVQQAARNAEQMGAGELLINSIDCDGGQNGYDHDLLKSVVREVSIPIIACGGAGKPVHFYDVIKNVGLSAVAAGNLFHFTEHSVMTSKAYLRQRGVDVRMDDRVTYEGGVFSEDGRLLKAKDEHLAALRFVYHPAEII